MLKVRDLVVSYGDLQAVRGVILDVRQGELITLIGANGAGKTSIVRAIIGLVRSTGSVRVDGRELLGEPPWTRPRLGIGYVPEGRRVFPWLTVEENLRMGAYARADRSQVTSDLSWVYSLFPVLRERSRMPAGRLSGGEQQMLAVGRALMARPRLLILDEISTGLMPILAARAYEVLMLLRARNVGILLAEQNARRALAIADRGYVLETGRIVLGGTAAELRADPRVQEAYLGAG